MVGIITRLMVEAALEKGSINIISNMGSVACAFGFYFLDLDGYLEDDSSFEETVTAIHEALEELRFDAPDEYRLCDLHITEALFPKTGVCVWYMPEGLPGREVFISPDGKGSFTHAINMLVDGWVEHVDVCFAHGPTIIVNEDGIAQGMQPNRILWATKHTHDTGYLRQRDYARVVEEDEAYTVLYGPVVAADEFYTLRDDDCVVAYAPVTNPEIKEVEKYISPGGEIAACVILLGSEIPKRTEFAKLLDRLGNAFSA